MDWIDDDLGERRRLGLYRVRRKIDSGQGAHIQHRGRALVNFSSNDYLDLASDPRLAQAAARAARRYGTGAGASPLVSGHLHPLRRLERDLARWEGSEATLVFSSGYTANLAVISALADRDSVIFSDELNHASLIDGCRLSRARTVVYRHADANHLAELLSVEKKAKRRLIVTDTVFSMDGNFAPLAELFDLARRHDCLLVIDEAHATGVLGDNGRGLAVDLDAEFVVKIGTLSKALGAQGGFVAASRCLVSWLINHARPYIFSTALAPPSAAAATRAVAIVQSEPQRRSHVLALAEQLRQQLNDLGYPVTPSRCQIVPVMVGEPGTALELSRRLEKLGFLVPAIRPPSVPEGTSRLRISLTAGHSAEDIERLVEALGNSIRASRITSSR
jgi:8-amino-7-oxononanoate synthase